MADKPIRFFVKKENLEHQETILQYCKNNPDVTISKIFNSLLPLVAKGLTDTAKGKHFVKMEGVIQVR